MINTGLFDLFFDMKANNKKMVNFSGDYALQ